MCSTLSVGGSVGMACGEGSLFLSLISFIREAVTLRGWAGPDGGAGACLLLPPCTGRISDYIIITSLVFTFGLSVFVCVSREWACFSLRESAVKNTSNQIAHTLVYIPP